MSVLNKLKWVVGILMVVVIIVATNLIDKDHFDNIRGNVISIYDDRLIAYDLIYKMTKAMQRKELALKDTDSTFYQDGVVKVNQTIKDALDAYAKTKLTEKEKRLFQSIKADFENIMAEETKLIDSGFGNGKGLSDAIDQFQSDLDQLADIQIVEGKRQVALSENTFELVELFTQIEIVILLILGVLIQVIVLYSPKKEN